jgi:hypothetical protein
MHGAGRINTMLPQMGKSYWRIIQDEIEAKSWTVGG